MFERFPIVSVTLTDGVIHNSGGNLTCFVGGLGRFPKEYWRKLDNHRTRTSALRALDEVCVDWGRSLVQFPGGVRLPPLYSPVEVCNVATD